jgi:gamma-glutamyl phosphate reductase
VKERAQRVRWLEVPPDKFSQFTQHYIQFEDQKLLEFMPTKKRKLIQALPEKLKNKAVSLLEENRYDLRTTTGLTKFISDLDN